MASRARRERRTRPHIEQRHVENELEEVVDTLAGLAVGEEERLLAAHELGVARHDFEARADIGGEILLVDHEDNSEILPRIFHLK